MSTRPLRDYWLALSKISGVGPRTLQHLSEQVTDLGALFHMSKRELMDLGLSESLSHCIQRPNWQAVEQDLRWAAQPNHHIICRQDHAYPPQLAAITYPPPILYGIGNIALLTTPQIAMVGSRQSTAAGLQTAYSFAQHLAQYGFTITSGLALGIDAASHRGALAVNGKTIAVMGCGLQRIYPARHRQLAAAIADTGLLLSEFAPLVTPKPEHFPRRNRIISGLSVGVLIVEAALKSGSLITAQYAAEQGREVFVVPGSIHNPLSQGNHKLLREGAIIVTQPNDITEEIPLNPAPEKGSPKASQVMAQTSPPTTTQTQLLQYIDYEPTTVDTIIERSDLTASLVSAMLVNLELAGLVHNTFAGYIRA